MTNVKLLIQSLTAKLQALQATAQSITLGNGTLIDDGLGPYPQIIKGLQELVSTFTGLFANSGQGPDPVFEGTDPTDVANAYAEFCRVHQALLNILIEKAAIFPSIATVGEPVAAALREDANLISGTLFGLLQLPEPKETELESSYTPLQATLDTAIKAYEGAQEG